MRSLVKVMAAVAVLAPVQLNAATQNIPFNGTVADTCVITMGSNGTIVPNAGYTQLSSTFAGGAAGTATILATGGGQNVSATAPASFSAAPGSAAGSTFTATYDLSGATTALGVAGATTTNLNAGSTNVAVDLTAAHPSGTFEAGTYTATVVLTCEP